MTPRDLLAAFETLANAPDGMKTLRELILYLAVQGALVPQHSSDESAAVLLEGRTIVGPKELPDGWSWTTLKNLGDIRGGGTPSKKEARFWGGSIPWVSPKDMKRDLIGESQLSVTPEAVEKSSVKMIPEGSLLFVVRGMILAHSFPAALTTASVTVNQDMKAVLPFDLSLSPYLLLAMKGLKAEVVGLVKRSTHGTCKLPSDAIFHHPIPVPPLAEQHRIVARVDELMGLLDRLEVARTQREKLRQKTRDAALAALREAEDAEEVEAAWGRIARDMDDLFTTPEDVGPLRQAILELAVRGRLVPAEMRLVGLRDLLREPLANGRSVPTGSGYPVLRLTALRGQVVDPSECKLGSWTAEEGRRFRIQAGDLLVVRGNGSMNLVARASMVESTEEVAFPDTAIRLRPDSAVVATKYLFYAWESPVTRKVLEVKAKTTAGIWKVSQGDLYGVTLPIPPLQDQHRIVAKVDVLISVCDDLEARLNTARDLQGQFAAAAVHHLDV